MIKLNQSASQYLQLITGQNGAVVDVSYSDKSSADFLGDSQLTSIVTATTTTICGTPAASVIRYIDFIAITNTYAGNHTITVQQNSSATAYPIVKDLVMSSGDRLEYTHACGWRVVDSTGAIHTLVATPQVVIAAGKTLTVNTSMTLSSTDGGTINLADAALFPTVASATAPDIFGAAGATINYTGTTTATSFAACTAAQVGSTKTIIPVTGASFTASANLIIDGATSGTILQPANANVQVIPLSTTQFKMTTMLAYGTWTPNQGSGLTLVGAFSSGGTYTKNGGLVYITGYVAGATSVALAAGGVICTNLPYSYGANVISLGNAMDNSATVVSVLRIRSSSGSDLLTIGAIGATAFIYFSISYNV